MRKLTAFSGLALLLLIGVSAAPLRAQEKSETGQESAQLNDAAQRLFKALAADDVSVVAQNTARKYIRKLSPAKLRPPSTGPKLTASFDGAVSVVRQSENDAVVEANIFTPESSDVPAGEVSRVRIYMVREEGDWKASAADKKEAHEDEDINGGWYHAAFFTLCPNIGLEFVPNHFSRSIKCEAVAQCARF